MASLVGDALQQLQGDDWVTRNTTLADLGITEPIVLEQQRFTPDEFYVLVLRVR